jgi:hypothetical protein
MLASGTQDRGSLPTEAVGFFLLEKSTACSTIRYKLYKRQLKVQYQDNEAQRTNERKKKKSSHLPQLPL